MRLRTCSTEINDLVTELNRKHGWDVPVHVDAYVVVIMSSVI